MKKYPISREFFPWNMFAPPISEKFLAMVVPHMKPPKSLRKDAQLQVTTHTVQVEGGEISCFVISPKALPEKAPCLLYIHGGGFVLEAAGYHYGNAMRYAKEVGCKVVFPLYRLAPPGIRFRRFMKIAILLSAGRTTMPTIWASTQIASASAATAPALPLRWAFA